MKEYEIGELTDNYLSKKITQILEECIADCRQDFFGICGVDMEACVCLMKYVYTKLK